MKISLLATLTAASGFILATHRATVDMLYSIIGIFLLACGSSALNQCQDRAIDRKMERTKLRPIPSGRILVSHTLIISFLLIFFGSILLLYGVHLTALALGLFAVILYNGLYTYLKRITIFAIIPGALIGALPPVVGFVAGGGEVFDPAIVLFAFFVFMWQVPHFWMLLLTYNMDYRKIGIPSLYSKLGLIHSRRVLFIWVLSTGSACLLLLFFGIVHSPMVHAIFFVGTLLLVALAIQLIKEREVFSSQFFFAMINIYALVIFVFFALDNLLV